MNEARALELVSKVCLRLPDAQAYVMVHHPAFRVGKKPFAIVGMNRGPTLSINLGHDAQDHLLTDARFVRTPYIGQHGWVTIAVDALEKGELEELIGQSWRRVAGKRRIAAFEND